MIDGIRYKHGDRRKLQKDKDDKKNNTRIKNNNINRNRHTHAREPQLCAVNNDIEKNYTHNAQQHRKQSNNGLQNNHGLSGNTTTRTSPTSKQPPFTDRQYNPNQQPTFAGIPLQHIAHPRQHVNRPSNLRNIDNRPLR